MLTLWACDDTVENNEILGYGDDYYAEYATISSSAAEYDETTEGGVINFAYSGGTVDVFVHCDVDWTWENSNSSVFSASSPDSDHLSITAGENTSSSELTGTITFVTAEERDVFATVTISQAVYVAPKITVETTEWHISAAGGTIEIAVEATADWTAQTGSFWITEEKTDASIILTALDNDQTTGRTAEVVLTCSDEKSSDSVTITVTQDGLE